MNQSKLHIRVLGAAAGGGFPQWNCNCSNCAGYRQGDDGFVAQTQSSIAVSPNGQDWVLFNTSPDIRQQLENTKCLQPFHPDKVGKRHSPIKAVLLTNGDIDHIAGSLILREKQPFDMYITSEIADVLAANPIFNALDPDFVTRHRIKLDDPIEVLPSLHITLFAVPGKVPLFMEKGPVVTDLEGEQTVGVKIDCGSETFFYIPGCARVTPRLAALIEGAPLILFDGTLWQDDEMIREGTGVKTGARMGHMSMSGDNGTIEAFKNLNIERKIFIHINNTNPVLNRH